MENFALDYRFVKNQEAGLLFLVGGSSIIPAVCILIGVFGFHSVQTDVETAGA